MGQEDSVKGTVFSGDMKSEFEGGNGMETGIR